MTTTVACPSYPDLSHLQGGHLAWAVITFMRTLPDPGSLNPGEITHHQCDWRCSTSMCLAGWVCQLTGGHWAGQPGTSVGAFVVAVEDDPADAVRLLSDLDRSVSSAQPVVHAAVRAARLLGLPTDDATELDLFAGDLDLDGVAEVAEGLFGPNPYA
ncbi:hypothetical protein ACIBKY_51440 [Nonomuraea sp. NPDC050394]|uniref:hypothetical protein n=1 Tax=Nonomuraea sp. NPDC050394 TaxID=3364363 RepID=UPI0037AE9171